MEGTKKKNTGYDEKQIKDARQFCGILQTVRIRRNQMIGGSHGGPGWLIHASTLFKRGDMYE